jgi:hypothetical protein
MRTSAIARKVETRSQPRAVGLGRVRRWKAEGRASVRHEQLSVLGPEVLRLNLIQ